MNRPWSPFFQRLWNLLVRRLGLEWFFWTGGLAALALGDPSKPHYSLCVFRLMGFRRCPGCGLGHAIGYLFRGQWQASWHSHPLGALALLLIVQRIGTLTRHAFKPLNPIPYGSQQLLEPSRHGSGRVPVPAVAAS